MHPTIPSAAAGAARPATRRPAEVSPDMLAVIRAGFAHLVDRPDPLGIDGSLIAGLPDRFIAVDELRSMLLHPSTRHATRDAALGLLVRRARDGEADWQVALLGVLAPGLANATVRAAAGYPGDYADLNSEAVVALLEVARTGTAIPQRVASRLLGVAFTKAWLLARRERRRARWEQAAAVEIDPLLYVDPSHLPLHSQWDRRPVDVLHAAVACGVLTRAQARLIACTRLDGVPLAEIAAGQKLSHACVRQRRHRAEKRLTAWIAQMEGDTATPAARVASTARATTSAVSHTGAPTVGSE